MTIRPLAIAPLLLALLLSGCGTPVPTQPADPKVVAEIVQACTGSGLFVAVNGLATSAVPVPGLAIAGQLVDAGITNICANPEQYAADAAMIAGLVKSLEAFAQQQKTAAMRRGTMR
jgi:hypothetical protein